MTEHLDDLRLDALRLGATDAPARAHLDGCDACRARHQALEAASAQFHARFDAVGLAADALQRAQAAPRPSLLRRLMNAPTVLASTIAALAIWQLSPGPQIRSKGADALLELFVIDGSERAAVEGPVPSDAHLAVRLAPHGPRELRLLWSSSPDAWAALYPSSDAPSWFVDKAAWLERAVVLDGAPEPEWLGVVACTEPVDHAAAVELLRGRGRADCTVQSVRIEKR